MSTKPEDTLHSEKDVKQLPSNEIDVLDDVLNRYAQYISHICNPDNYGDFDENMTYREAKQALVQYISTLVEGIIGIDETSEHEIENDLFYATRNGLRLQQRQKLNEWKNNV